jgi:hypothetical protein
MSADRACPESYTACFAIRAAAEPGILPRLIELFAKRDLVPAAVLSRRLGAERLAVDLQIDGIDRKLAEQVAETMRQMVSVERVLLADLPVELAGRA